MTGISRGLGQAVAEELLRRGHFVIGTTRSGSSVEARKTSFGLVGAVEEVTTEEAQMVFQTNFFGTWNVIRAVLPHLRANRSGYIVNFSSIGGITGSVGNGLYNASRFVVEGMSEALELEVKPFGITVTVVEPGYFRTGFLSSSSIQKAAKIIDSYEQTFGLMRKAALTRDGSQTGDPMKPIAIIIDAIESGTPPLRLPLGVDAFTRIEGKISRLQEEMGQWREMASATEFTVEPAHMDTPTTAA